MRARQGVWALVLAFGCSGLVQAAPRGDEPRTAQENQEHRDQDRDRDRDHDRDRDEKSYYSNSNYQRGWKDGLHHKHKNHKWKNDNDRLAYEAGYAHGDRGEKWENPNRRRDDDHR
jgi:hypothetical protein